MDESYWWCWRNCVTEWRRRWETWRMRRDGGGIICYDKEVVWGVATSGEVAWFVTIRIVLVVCKIMGWDSDGTSEHEEWFKDGRQIVYKESVVDIGGFPFLLSLLVLLYSTASYDFEIASTFVLSWFSRHEHWASLSCFLISHYCDQYHLHPTPPVTLERVLHQENVF
jgi:hypothetical protein